MWLGWAGSDLIWSLRESKVPNDKRANEQNARYEFGKTGTQGRGTMKVFVHGGLVSVFSLS